MLSWPRIKTALGYLFTFALIVCTFIAVQSQSDENEPSAEGRLSQYYGPQAVALLNTGGGGLPYPGDVYPGDWPPLYPGDEKWDGQYSGNRRYPADVQALATDGQVIFAGGENLPVYPYEPSFPLARWQNNQWSQVADGTNGLMQGKVYAVATQGSTLYAGGSISLAGAVAVKNVARWNGTQWNAMAGGVYMNAGEGDVAAIAVNGTDVYVGGWFDRAGGQVVSNIARWDGAAWHPLGSGLDRDVKAIAVKDGIVYVGGAFTNAGGITVNHIARWDGANWSAMGGGTNEMVNTIAIQGSDVYIGGDFSSASDAYVRSIARWDGSRWQAMGSGLPGSVQTIKATSEGIYAAGYFHPVIGQYTAFNIALWNGSSWANLGSGVQIGPVNDAVPLDNRLFTGGKFSLAGNNWSDGFAIWNHQAETVVLGSGDSPVAPGSTIYLYGMFFPPLQPVELRVNGDVLDSNLVSDADGKIYIRLLTNPNNDDGVYRFTLTSPTHTSSGTFTLQQNAQLFTTGFAGRDFTYPAFTVMLPVVRR